MRVDLWKLGLKKLIAMHGSMSLKTAKNPEKVEHGFEILRKKFIELFIESGINAFVGIWAYQQYTLILVKGGAIIVVHNYTKLSKLT